MFIRVRNPDRRCLAAGLQLCTRLHSGDDAMFLIARLALEVLALTRQIQVLGRDEMPTLSARQPGIRFVRTRPCAAVCISTTQRALRHA